MANLADRLTIAGYERVDPHTYLRGQVRVQFPPMTNRAIVTRLDPGGQPERRWRFTGTDPDAAVIEAIHEAERHARR